MWMRGKVGWTPSSRAHLIRWAVMAVELTTLFGCDSTTAPKPPVWDSTWPVWEAPEQAGFSAAGLAEVESYVETLSTTGLLVVVGGQVLHAQGDVSEVTYIASVRKSILSILYGRHVADGAIDLTATLGQRFGLRPSRP